MILKGWARPANAQKWHYFDNDLTSLCGRWMFAGDYAEDESDDHADNCAECKRKKKRQESRVSVDKA